MENELSCVRVLPDQEQIRQCTERVKQSEPAFNRLARVLDMGGNTNRLKIIYLLHSESNLCVCDLSDILGVSIQAVSQHLRKLKDADLILARKVGQTVFYSLRQESTNVFGPLLPSIKLKEVPKAI